MTVFFAKLTNKIAKRPKFRAKFANHPQAPILISEDKSISLVGKNNRHKLLDDNFRHIKKKRIFTGWYTKTGFYQL
ncbi:hypothetical protein [Flavobacterium caeni]|uniref:hypothetical protein n=1 Tax=Flavobacterium caeni TaxID=490189 RepID=UPI000B87D406|nr:hypothetical protein [Flavobacterium caeni]